VHDVRVNGTDEGGNMTIASTVAANLTGADCRPNPDRMVNPEALAAAARFVQNDWGHEGYRVGVIDGNMSVVVLRVEHFDGSQFNVIADRYGNTERDGRVVRS
jgi:hypothetical protein